MHKSLLYDQVIKIANQILGWIKYPSPPFYPKIDIQFLCCWPVDPQSSISARHRRSVPNSIKFLKKNSPPLNLHAVNTLCRPSSHLGLREIQQLYYFFGLVGLFWWGKAISWHSAQRSSVLTLLDAEHLATFFSWALRQESWRTRVLIMGLPTALCC